jgi:hypothetical protein
LYQKLFAEIGLKIETDKMQSHIRKKTAINISPIKALKSESALNTSTVSYRSEKVQTLEKKQIVSQPPKTS